VAICYVLFAISTHYVHIAVIFYYIIYKLITQKELSFVHEAILDHTRSKGSFSDFRKFRYSLDRYTSCSDVTEL